MCSMVRDSFTDRSKPFTGWFLDLSKEDDARIRSLYPVACVLPYNVGHYPLLLCRFVEDAGKDAPNPELLLNSNEKDRTEAKSQLKVAVDEILSGCESRSVCSSTGSSFVVGPPRHYARPPAEAMNQTSFRRRPGAVTFQDPMRDQKASVRGARARAVVAPWWHTWLKDIDKAIGRTSLQEFGRLHKEAASNLPQHSVPAHVRPAMWLWLAAGGAPEKLKPEVYLKWTLQQPESQHASSVEARLREQIEMDIRRTPSFLFKAGGQVSSAEPSFELRSGFDSVARKKAAVQRLLIAYSRYCPEVGYCQGLNLVAAVLLSVLDEQLAFVVLCALLEKMPSDLHSANPDRLAETRQDDERKLLGALKIHQPELVEHLEDIEFDANCFLPRWLSCLFASVLDVDATVRLWDHVLGEEGDTAVSRLALAALGRMLQQFLAAPDFVEAAQVVAQVPATCKTPEDVDEMLAKDWPASKFKDAIEAVPSSSDANGYMPQMPSSLEGGAPSPRTQALLDFRRDEQLVQRLLVTHRRDSPQDVRKEAYLQGLKACAHRSFNRLSMLPGSDPYRSMMYAVPSRLVRSRTKEGGSKTRSSDVTLPARSLLM
eukprot:TRINITY_DN25878_c0_g1_i1.p1 TRINITY_DN25878_c0_g1~~TRINITY_DN25878_c0_g1_i1.p1  ORF type:complete len:631 (+),score=50.50 TRINITY_DN25878_c0_g1_i1:99-1895(+)